MQYMGSKNRISKELKPFLDKHLEVASAYIEPFVGGANMIDKVKHQNKVGADYNKYLISLWSKLQEGWIPPTTISKEDYYYVKNNQDEDEALTAFVGFLCSFGGKWFGGYAKNSKGDNYAERGSRVLCKQIHKLQDVKFIHSSYQDLEMPKSSVIYCDPPYEGTTKYKDDFNHSDFWEWCRGQVKGGNYIYVSEYNAPDDFVCVWSKVVKTVLNKNNQETKRTERLFVHKSQYQEALLD